MTTTRMTTATTWIGKLIKVGKGVTLGLAGLVTALAITVAFLERRSYQAPLPDITASTDPMIIARGAYLANGPAHCRECHGAVEQRAELAVGKPTPLSGGLDLKLPIGIFRPANITSDPETGIGKLSDGQIARALRYGVRRDGRALMPFMPFADLSDEDLRAVISYLRTQAPVKRAVQTRAPTLLGHVALALFVRPQGPTGPAVAPVPRGPTVAYGHYLVHSVANCAGCHTKRDLRTGALIGPVLAGGFAFTDSDKMDFVTPNLTPDPATGRITSWNEDLFLARLHLGRGPEGSPMPWAAFGKMDDDDLRAVYRYLRSLPPVERDNGPSVRSKTGAPIEAPATVAGATPSSSR